MLSGGEGEERGRGVRETEAWFTLDVEQLGGGLQWERSRLSSRVQLVGEEQKLNVAWCHFK